VYLARHNKGRVAQMANYEFIRIGQNGTSYDDLIASWAAETEALGEDFDTYSAVPVSVFQQIMEKDADNTGLFAVRDAADSSFAAVCMLNHAHLSNYDGPVLRVRHILLSPKFDLGDMEIMDYVDVLFAILNGVITHSEMDAKMKGNHIKFHARSPADMTYFSALGQALGSAQVYASVQMKGAWLYITRTEDPV
jgi:hypothetical protein